MPFIQPVALSNDGHGQWNDVAASSFFILQEQTSSKSSLTPTSLLQWVPFTYYFNASSEYTHRILLKSRESKSFYLIALGPSLSDIIEDWRLVETVLFPQVCEWQVMGTLTHEKLLGLIQKIVDSFIPEEQVRAAKERELETEKLVAIIQAKQPSAEVIAYFTAAYSVEDQYPKKGKIALSQHHFFFIEDIPNGLAVVVPYIHITYAKISLLQIKFHVKNVPSTVLQLPYQEFLPTINFF
ncbi:hypothetical protein HMI55_006980 [Coelomomyces lativittatus]|nr:hypothetical protein HMI55_006980 [Coelomomyces lativittatus]KAJ1513682.1 hypothetical protein HMI56_001968 [Coelomomyces lativittatus]